jgi:type I restriction enzyme S subunit
MEVSEPSSLKVAADWKELPLSDLYEFKNGVNADKGAYGRGVPFINVLEPITYSHLRGSEISGLVSLTPLLSATYEVRAGDLVFNRTSEIAEEVGLSAAYLGSERVVFGGFVIRGRPRGNAIDASFAAYALRGPAVRSQIVAMGQGAVRANIGQDSLRRVVLCFPNLEEQRAIALALTDADALIDSLEQLLTKKRQIKQGAMQELLTGKRRLPGFDSRWDVSTVGGEFDVALGKMLDSERNVGTLKPYLGNRSVQWGQINVADVQMMAFASSELERYRLKAGDLLVCEGGEIGRAAIWSEPLEECYYQKALHRLRPTRRYDPRLMLEFLKLWAATGALANYVTQTSIAHLPREKFLEVPLVVPPPAEQRAIVEVLSEMEVEIAAIESRLKKARDLKQAMAQALLTGRIRLVEPQAA